MLDMDNIVAMAVAAIAEELKTDIKRVRVKAFSVVQKSNLEKYIEDNNISYSKFTLGDRK